MRVLLLGGGRWGRVHAQVLHQILPEDATVTWVSHHNKVDAESAIARMGAENRFALVDDLEDAVALRPTAAIVATATHTHARYAAAVLAHGLHTYVEKPLTLNLEDAKALVEAAREKALVLGIGTELLEATYLHHFRSLLSSSAIADIRIEWTEAEFDVRHGMPKRLDLATPRVHDVFPHIWSILRVLIPERQLRVTDATPGDRGAATIGAAIGEAPISAFIDRRAAGRRRFISIAFADGRRADLDFTIEPGTITLDGTIMPSDPDWGHRPTPLAAALMGFLRAVAMPQLRSSWSCSAVNALESVSSTVAAADLLKRREIELMSSKLSKVSQADASCAQLLIDNLYPELAAAGAQVPYENADQVVAAALQVLRTADGAIEPPLPARALAAIESSPFLRAINASRGGA